MLVPVPLLLRVYYFFPDYPSLIAPEFILQLKDIVPEIPKVNRFLDRFQRNTGVRYAAIELSGGNFPVPIPLQEMDGKFQLN